jgi:hypothetical protein
MEQGTAISDIRIVTHAPMGCPQTRLRVGDSRCTRLAIRLRWVKSTPERRTWRTSGSPP